MFDVIIPAAGESSRFLGTKNKLLCKIFDKTVLECAVLPFLDIEGLDKIIIPTSKEIKDDVIRLFNDDRIIVIDGGKTRTESVNIALTKVFADYVLIHDGARPYVTRDIIYSVLNGAIEKGAAVPVIKVTDSIVDVSSDYEPKNRDDFRFVQTPQGFKTSLLKECYSSIATTYSDDIAVYLTKYNNIRIVDGSADNKKITYNGDIFSPVCRTGTGFDTHRLVDGRKLVIGGVEIPYEKGLLGHSDADVLIHAIMDAILSALGLPDIGHFFPDDDEKYKDICSIILLKEVAKKVKEEGYLINNISATVIAEKPKLYKYRDAMLDVISNTLNIDKSNIGIAFTTTEGMYNEGHGLAMSAMSYITIIKQ